MLTPFSYLDQLLLKPAHYLSCQSRLFVGFLLFLQFFYISFFIAFLFSPCRIRWNFFFIFLKGSVWVYILSPDMTEHGCILWTWWICLRETSTRRNYLLFWGSKSSVVQNLLLPMKIWFLFTDKDIFKKIYLSTLESFKDPLNFSLFQAIMTESEEICLLPQKGYGVNLPRASVMTTASIIPMVLEMGWVKLL